MKEEREHNSDKNTHTMMPNEDGCCGEVDMLERGSVSLRNRIYTRFSSTRERYTGNKCYSYDSERTKKLAIAIKKMRKIILLSKRIPIEGHKKQRERENVFMWALSAYD